MIDTLKKLRDLGNTVVVVEHDRTMIEAADEVIDLGPLGGRQGGSILFQGPVSGIKKSSKSLTGQYLAGTREVLPEGLSHPASPLRGKKICIRKAAEHNLRDIDVDIPLGQFVVITGVSGSGKSTLLYEVLYHHYLRHQGKPVQDLGRVKSIEGFEHVDEMIVVDQSPMGRSPRSNPVTYLKAFDDIRKILIVLEETARAFPPQNVFFDKIVLGPLDRAPTMIWALGNKITSYEMGKIKEFLGKGFGDAGVRAHGENPHHFIAHITLACSNGNIVVPPEYIFPSLEAEFTAPTLELFESVKENGKREYIPLTSFDFTDGAS